jgi:hypothetical protein
MQYRLVVDQKFPLFSEHTPGVGFNRTPLSEKRFRPKMMKKLVRTVKRTKARIISVKSEFAGKAWVKIITIGEREGKQRWI